MEKFEKVYSYEGRDYNIVSRWDVFVYEDLVLNIEQVRNWCREGCPNFDNNGGCPPFSPTADELLKGREFILLTSKVNVAELPYGSADEKSKFVEKLLCSFMDELGYKIKEKTGTNFLNPGHCRGCEECTIASGCKNPERRVFSITGMGIMLGDVIEKLFGEKLQWFSKDSEPKHIIKIMGFYKDNEIKTLNSSINSLIKEL